jgi:hypothetical protein
VRTSLAAVTTNTIIKPSTIIDPVGLQERGDQIYPGVVTGRGHSLHRLAQPVVLESADELCGTKETELNLSSWRTRCVALTWKNWSMTVSANFSLMIAIGPYGGA